MNAHNPFAIIFGCSDSRLPAEIIFDLGLGDAFVVRTAGHVLDEAVIGSLEYGVDVLKVPLIVILGHDSCGAVTAAKKTVDTGEMPRGVLRDLVERITPSVLTPAARRTDDINDMVIENVEQILRSACWTARGPFRSAVEAGRTAVVGVAYRLADGRADLVAGHRRSSSSNARRRVAPAVAPSGQRRNTIRNRRLRGP